MPWSIIAHGGAGDVPDSPEAHSVLRRIIEQGAHALQNGATSEEAVEMTIRAMEEHPLFNAGLVGSVTTTAGHKELEASIMRGSDLAFGMVIGSQNPHPITLARQLMHGARGAYYSFYDIQTATDGFSRRPSERQRLGTVGCVALDLKGHLCAGTSTGGISGKPPHRFADASIIGLGTYADDRVVAVSTSGYGEQMIPHVLAFHLWALMTYRPFTLSQALHELTHTILPRGSAGIIAIDPMGHVASDFNTRSFIVESMTQEEYLSLT